MTKSWQVCCLLVLLCNCVSELDIDTKEIDHEIVINSFFSETDTVIVNVSRSSSIADDSTYPIEGLKPIIYSNQDTFHLAEEQSGNYILEPGILTSEISYKLSIINEREKQISGKSSIPKSARILSGEEIFPAGFDEYGDPYTEYTFTIEDVPGQINYYEVFIIYISNHNSSTIYSAKLNEYVNFLDPIIEAEGLEGYANSSFLFKDELFQDSTADIRLKFEPYSADVIIPPLENLKLPNGNYIILFTLSEEYYEFRRSWVIHQYHQQTNPELFPSPIIADIRDFLFKADVQELYTNISGGYGFFAGYNLTFYKIN